MDLDTSLAFMAEMFQHTHTHTRSCYTVQMGSCPGDLAQHIPHPVTLDLGAHSIRTRRALTAHSHADILVAVCLYS